MKHYIKPIITMIPVNPVVLLDSSNPEKTQITGTKDNGDKGFMSKENNGFWWNDEESNDQSFLDD